MMDSGEQVREATNQHANNRVVVRIVNVIGELLDYLEKVGDEAVIDLE